MPEKSDDETNPRLQAFLASSPNEFGRLACKNRIENIIRMHTSEDLPFPMYEMGMELSMIALDIRSGKSLTEEQKRLLEVLSGQMIGEGIMIKELFKNV